MEIFYEYQLNQATSTPKNQSNLRFRHNNSWSPPPNDVLKLNMDVHFVSDGHWGLGPVLRKEDEVALER
jgi:predicted component of type VI protein secretion system